MYAILANILLGFFLEIIMLKYHTICCNVHNHFQVQKIVYFRFGLYELTQSRDIILQPSHGAAQSFTSRPSRLMFLSCPLLIM
jgi:hypothetical protein